MSGLIMISFDDGKASFEVRTEKDEQLFTAMLGLEAYIAAKLGLHINDIRDIMDDIRASKQVVDGKALKIGKG